MLFYQKNFFVSFFQSSLANLRFFKLFFLNSNMNLNGTTERN